MDGSNRHTTPADGSPDVQAGPPITDALLAALSAASGDATEDIPALLEVVAEGLGFDVATLWRWRPEDGALCCEYVWQRPGCRLDVFLDATLGSTLRPGEPVPGTVLVSQAPEWVGDVAAYPNFRRGPAAVAAGLSSGFAFPIRARDETVGVFELFALGPRKPDEPLFAEVTRVAAHLGDVLERLDLEAQRSRLLIELEKAHQRQNFLLEVNRALATTRGLAATIERLAVVAVPVIGDLCLVDVATDEGITRLAAHHADPALEPLVEELRRFPPDPQGEHPAAIVMRTGRSLIAPEMGQEFLSATTQSSRHFDLTRRLDFTSYICAPLLSSERTIGALTLVSAGSGRRFGDQELSIAEELAAQVTSVLEREQRYDEQYEVAHFLQRSMLPERLDVPAGIEVCARYVASNRVTEVGGDFYDLVHLDATRVAFVIGDVTGHDLVAITAMAKTRSALRAFLQLDPAPDRALESLDRFVAGLDEQRLVTVAIGVLEIDTGMFDLATAGHPPPLLVDGAVTALPCAAGPLAGLGRGRYPVCRSVVPHGAGVVFYTDGLVERRDGGPEARLAHLTKALLTADRSDLGTACDTVISATLEGMKPSDDVAFLWAIRR
ncbi:MAG: SpoIIE family protein phosphatase [Acidimicrobiaceae bacterium]|nr:SpoIIE family protein phosphatase [Acidimicrobiaceae bacterium]